MSKFDIIVDEINNALHVALIKNGKLDDLFIDIPTASPRWASIYYGRVTKIDTALNSAFIDLGDGYHGFLPMKHVHIEGRKKRSVSKIGNFLKTGDMIVVQVKAEMTRGGLEEHEKLPRLTMKLQLFGRTLTYSPNISKLLHAPQLSKSDISGLVPTLKEFEGGWIIRESIKKFEDEDTLAEARILHKIWTSINEIIEENKNTPTPKFMFVGPDAIRRALIDYSSHDVGTIEIANDKAYEMAIKWCERYAPELTIKIIKPDISEHKSSKKFDLFDFRDIRADIDMLGTPTVEIEGGGSIIIEDTRAMTVIDVNIGSAKDVISVNNEASLEIARQIRLRNICGMIVVDFISMQNKNERHSLLKELEKAVESDPARPQLHGFTRLSNFEITRKRRTHALKEKLESLSMQYGGIS